MNTWMVIFCALIIYWLGLKGIAALVRRLGIERQVSLIRMQYVTRTIATVWTLSVVLILSFITGVEYHDVGLFVSSLIALLGVALFAQWSILSNITASVMIFFFFPFRVGNWVKIIDGENSIEGEVTEISLFHIVLKGDDGMLLTYPNSMIFQKAVSILPKKKQVESDIAASPPNQDKVESGQA